MDSIYLVIISSTGATSGGTVHIHIVNEHETERTVYSRSGANTSQAAPRDHRPKTEINNQIKTELHDVGMVVVEDGYSQTLYVCIGILLGKKCNRTLRP